MGRGLFDRLQNEIADREKQEAISPLDLLELPEALRRLLQRIIRRGPTTARELVEDIGSPEDAVESMLCSLADKGYLTALSGSAPTRYKAVLGQRRARTLPSGIWDTLAKKIDGEP
jgi:predicted transcriptional regulator